MSIKKLPTASDIPRPIDPPDKVPMSDGLRGWFSTLMRWMTDLVRTLDTGQERRSVIINQLIDATASAPSATGVAGTTKATPGTVDTWLTVTHNGTTYYVPAYLSQTS